MLGYVRVFSAGIRNRISPSGVATRCFGTIVAAAVSSSLAPSLSAAATSAATAFKAVCLLLFRTKIPLLSSALTAASRFSTAATTH